MNHGSGDYPLKMIKLSCRLNVIRIFFVLSLLCFSTGSLNVKRVHICPRSWAPKEARLAIQKIKKLKAKELFQMNSDCNRLPTKVT